ncbi:MAG: glycyl-radical enzyme activating protein [Synergistaceae bacterium]|jgi:pyruvate formate lyase activating enzyme|nr:glycyl-radical enzyme activating protein [Synergistaceae bacterium]
MRQDTEDGQQGIVFDFKRYALHDGPGIRVSVHLKGCPLSCLWCHNPESQAFEPRPLFRQDRCIGCLACASACPEGAVSASSGGILTDAALCVAAGRCADVCPSGAREMCGKRVSVGETARQVLKERVFFEQSGGGVTLTGGEPLCQPEFTLALLRWCKSREIHTALDTSGFADPSVVMEAARSTDLFLCDVKIMDADKHREFTGVDNDIILSNISMLSGSGAAIWARMPFIPGLNSDAKNIRSAGKFLSGLNSVLQINLFLLPYHGAAEDKHDRWKMKFDLCGLAPPTENSLRNAAATLESFGLRVSIGG